MLKGEDENFKDIFIKNENFEFEDIFFFVGKIVFLFKENSIVF